MAQHKMIIGIISCGSIGQRHIRNFLSQGHEVVAYNRSNKRRKIVEKKFNINVFNNMNSIIDLKPDLAVICSPNIMHLDHANIFANNHINLFIEKPLCIPNQNILSLKKLIKKKKLFSHVGCNLRFNKGIILLKKILDEKKIGKIINAEFFTGMYLPDWHPYEDYKQMYSSKKKLGGGVLMDMTHELDLATWFFGDFIKSTSILKNSPYLKTETTNVANALVEFKNKTTVYFNLNYFEKPYRREIKIFGSKGKVSLDLINCKFQLFYGNKKITKNYKTYYDHNSMYLEQNKYVIKNIKAHTNSFNDVSFSEKVIKLADSIQNNNILKKR